MGIDMLLVLGRSKGNLANKGENKKPKRSDSLQEHLRSHNFRAEQHAGSRASLRMFVSQLPTSSAYTAI